jgi:hypothetical protein
VAFENISLKEFTIRAKHQKTNSSITTAPLNERGTHPPDAYKFVDFQSVVPTGCGSLLREKKT